MTLSEYKQKWDKILIITPVFILISFGYVLSGIVGNVLFVERVSAEYLPYMYVIGAFGIALTTMIVSGLLAKKNMVILLQLYAIAGLIFFIGNILLIKGGSSIGYPLFFILGQVFYIVLGDTILWNLAIKICTPFEGKRAFGYFATGESIGGILAGLASSFLSGIMGTENLIFLIIGSLAATYLFLIFVHHRYREKFAVHHHDTSEIPKEEPSQIESIKEGFRDYRKFRIAKLLLIILTIFYIVSWMSDYEFQKIVGDSFSEDEFSRISGILSIVQNISLVGILLFFQHRIFKWLGVLNTLILSPILVLIPFGVMFFYQIPLAAGIALFMSNIMCSSLFANSFRLMSTAIPGEKRDSVVTFVSGNSDSIAMLGAGAGLIVLTKFLPNFYIIGVSVALLIILIGVILFTKREYIKQILKNLQGEDREDIHGAIENLAERSYHSLGVKELMKLLQWKELDPETVRKIVFALGKIDNVHVIPSLLDIFWKYDSTVKYAIIEGVHSFSHLNEQLKDLPFTRLNILDTYKRIFLEEEDAELKVFILEHLKDFDPDNVIQFLCNAIAQENIPVRNQAIKAMRYFNDRGIVKYVRPFLEDTDVTIRASSLIALWQFSEMRPILLKKIIEIMGSEESKSVLSALSIIGKLKFEWENEFVKEHLQDQNPEIKIAAALTMLDLDDEQGLFEAVKNLINKTPYSLMVARHLKEISVSMKKRILNEVRLCHEKAIETCVGILKDTYLNFSEEIESFHNEKAPSTSISSASL